MIGLYLLMLFDILKAKPIPCPETMLGLNAIERAGQHWFLLDSQQQTIFKLDAGGRLVSTYAKRGFGPGEMQRTQQFRVYADRLYLCDLRRQTLTQLTTDFEFIAEYKNMGMIRDVVITQNAVFVLSWRAENGHMIQKYNPDMQLQTSFGTALQGRALTGSQAGSLLLINQTLVFQHIGLPQLEFFDLNGRRSQKITYPQFEGPLLTEKHFMGSGQTTQILTGCFYQNKNFYIRVRGHKPDDISIFSFPEKNQHFSQLIPFHVDLIRSSSGTVFEVVSNDDNIPQSFKPYIFKKEIRP